MSQMELNDRDYLKFLQEDSKVVRSDFFTSVTGVDFTWANQRKLCGPRDQLDSSECYLRSLRDGYSFGLPRGEEVWSQCEWDHYSIQQIVDCMLHLKCKTLDPKSSEDSTFEEIFSYLKTSGLVEEQFYRFRGNKGICRDPRCDENPSTQKGRSRRLQALEPDIDLDCVRAKVRDEKLTSTSLTNFDEMKEVIKRTPVAIQVKLTKDLTNFSTSHQVDVEQVYPPKMKKGKKVCFNKLRQKEKNREEELV